jgi:hypothetical protein
MDRLLLTLSNDGRVAYATADRDAFHLGPVGGGAAARVDAEDINDLAFCGELLLVCTKDGLVRIRRRDAWAYTLKVSEEAGACTVAPGATQEAWYRAGGLLTRLKFDGAPTASHFAFSRPPSAIAPVDAETLIGAGSTPTVAELVAKPPSSSLIKAAWRWLRPVEPKEIPEGVVDLSQGKRGTLHVRRTCFDDSRRQALNVSIAPTCTLCAVADNKGRVLLVDLRSGRVVRLFKGVRDAQCAWLRLDDGEDSLYLAILAPQRKQIRVWRCRFGGCAAAFTVELENASLVQAPSTAFLAALRGDSLVLEPVQPDLERCRALADEERQRARLAGAQARCRAALQRADAKGDPNQARKAMKEAVKEESEENVLGLCVRTFTSSSCLVAVLETSKDERAKALISCEKARDLVTRDFAGNAQSSIDDPRLLEARAWLTIQTTAERTHPLVEQALAMLLKRDAAPAGLVDSVNGEDGAASFFRGHRAFRATFYKEMVAQTFRIGFRPLAVGKTEDASEAATALASSCCASASTLCAPLASCDLSAVEVVDEACTLLDLDRGKRALATTLWFLRLSSDDALKALESGSLQKWLRFYIIDRAAVLRAAQLQPPSKAEKQLHELAAETRAVVTPCIKLCRSSHSQVQALAFACAITSAVRVCAAAAEDKCHGALTADDHRWGLATLDGEIATLRCAVVVAKGPSQLSDVTANALRDERGRLAYAICADAAACDEDEQVPAALSGEGVKLAEFIRKRPERGWLHRAFPELDADALRCLRALMRAADAVDDGWALAASCSDVRKSSSSKNGAARCCSAWCACELWRTAIAPKVSKRVKGEDGAISERDGDGALFGAAVDVLEALIASYDAVRPYAGPANVLVRGADDGFVSLAIPLEAVRDAYTVPAESRLIVLKALARSLVAGLSIAVDAAGVADLFGDVDLDLEHAASDAEVAAAAEAEKTLAVALSNPAAADALRAKRAERAGAELADELASEEVFEDARDAESDDDNW